MQVQSRACGQLASQTLSIIQLLAFAKHIYPHYMCVSIHINIFHTLHYAKNTEKLLAKKLLAVLYVILCHINNRAAWKWIVCTVIFLHQ